MTEPDQERLEELARVCVKDNPKNPLRARAELLRLAKDRMGATITKKDAQELVNAARQASGPEPEDDGEWGDRTSRMSPLEQKVQERKELRAQKTTFTHAHYVGGHSGLGRNRNGNLFVTTTAIGIGTVGPKVAVIPIDDTESVEVSGGQVAKSKVGAVIGFGVLGGLAAKGAKDQSALIVRTKSGETAYYTVEKQDPIKLRAKITPILRAAGVPFYDEYATPTPTTPPPAKSFDLAEELRKLAGLRDDGLLTEEEFLAEKAKLLAQ